MTFRVVTCLLTLFGRYLQLSFMMPGFLSLPWPRTVALATRLPVRIVHVAPDGSHFEEKTDDALDESGFKVSAADIVAYIREQHDKSERRISVINFIQERKCRTQSLTDCAM
jgi:hypothetical protein